ncbi:MAG: AAA family ATPase [Candidatus Eisenbacteria bacterium]|nr:AAA family ATPase [Candidatus Eisenbacteria bacterium]
MADAQPLALTPDQLRWTCDPGQFGFESAEELPIAPGIIGQERAMEAIRLGVRIRSKGHNIFVSGPAGSGRATTVRHLLEQIDSGRGAPPDLVYVHNFREPDHPAALLLPAGRGRELERELREFVLALRRAIPQMYESDDWKRRRKELIELHGNQEKEQVRTLETRVREAQFALVQVQMGPFSRPEVAPLVEGEPRPLDQLESLAAQGKFPVEELARLRQLYDELRTLLEETFKQGRDVHRRLKEALARLEQDYGRPIVVEALEDIKESFCDARLSLHLDQVRDQILSNLRLFIDKEPEEGEEPPRVPLEDDERYRPFLVNVVVDNTGITRPPVVVETAPNYRNLFGTIEKVVDRTGHWRTDFMHIRPGSVLRANGGFLIIDLMDAAAEPGVWAALKRTLRHQQIDIQSFDPTYLLSTSALKPEPVRIDIRVIALGDAYMYHYLWSVDPDFRKIFKVKAEFDTVMPRDAASIIRYASFIRNVCAEEGLVHPDRSGVAALIEHGVRLAGQGGKLSTRFSELADLLREASYWAELEGATVATRVIVERALRERERRHRVPEEKMQELIEDGTIRIETVGGVIGQVNGLSVFDLGDHRFGKPTRITAQCSLGQGGLLSIEREAELSGRSFNKAMLIIEGFFRARFGQDYPMSLTASIAFEQSYGEVDGDSASVAEIVALVSALAELPVRQELAVTGSADQVGHTQPIGGVNEKVEGFFEVCRARGLTGTQGVVLPRENVQDLQLHSDVVEAVRAGQFHVYAASSVEEAIELLLGVKIGQRAEDGLYEENSVFGRVQDRVHYYAERMREFGKPPDGPEGLPPGGEGGHTPHPDPGSPATDPPPSNPEGSDPASPADGHGAEPATP